MPNGGQQPPPPKHPSVQPNPAHPVRLAAVLPASRGRLNRNRARPVVLLPRHAQSIEGLEGLRHYPDVPLLLDTLLHPRHLPKNMMQTQTQTRTRTHPQYNERLNEKIIPRSTTNPSPKATIGTHARKGTCDSCRYCRVAVDTHAHNTQKVTVFARTSCGNAHKILKYCCIYYAAASTGIRSRVPFSLSI